MYPVYSDLEWLNQMCIAPYFSKSVQSQNAGIKLQDKNQTKVDSLLA